MTFKSASPSLPVAVRSWWRQRVSRIGLRRTFGELMVETWEFLRDSTPERRRQRYGDVEYDWEYRVDTTSATVRWQDRLLGIFHSAYQPTEPATFREMVEGLGIDYERYTFIDLGSGKGRTLLMASEYPFRNVVGVELLPELHRVAEENIRKVPSERRRCGAVTSLSGDATQYVFPQEPLVLYLFHPLPEAGLERVMGNLTRSLTESPRAVWVVYHNPVLETIVANCRGLRRVRGAAQYAVYASDQTGASAVSN
jgi:SAM-dependent methyltransferase